MKIGDFSALGALGGLTATGAEEPRDLGEQMEFVFAQQLLAALNAASGKEGEDGGEYLSLLSDHLAREIARGGGLGIGRQLTQEVQS